MKTNLLSLAILLVLMSSCATNGVDSEISNISNNDFKPVAKIRYKSTQDFYSLKLMDSDVLERETVARANRDTLGDAADQREDYLFKAIALCYEGRFKDARSVFDSIYKKFVNNPSFWNHQGSCSLLEGKISQANLYYLKSLELAKKYTPSVNNIGVIYQMRGDEQKAVAAFEKAIRTSSRARTPRFNISRILLKNGLARSARINLMPLYKQKMDDDEVLGLIAISYLMEGELSKSLKFFSKVSDERLKIADFGLNYAILQTLLGMKDDAEKTFERVDKSTIGQDKRYYQQVKRYIGL